MFQWGPFLLIQVYSIQICILLCRKGTSQEVKNYVLFRHFTYLALFNIYFFFTIKYFRTREEKNYPKIFDLLGLFLALTRFVEPYVFQTFRSELTLSKLNCCCKKISKKEQSKYSEKPLCSFTSSVLNVEFVYLILVGISQFMNRDKNQEVKGNKIKIKKSEKSTRIIFKYTEREKSNFLITLNSTFE